MLGDNGVTYAPNDKRTIVITHQEQRARGKYSNQAPPPAQFPWELVTYVAGTMGVIILLTVGVAYTAVRMYG